MRKIMKSDFTPCRNLPFLPRALFVGIALSALISAPAFAEVVNASFATGAEVPVVSEGFTATGKTVNLTLNFAPAEGKDLMLVHNTGSDFIQGKFSNLVQGQIVTLKHRGMAYHFVANYYGGNGRDLVLMPTRLDDLSATALEKLDSQLVLALKKSRAQAPFDRPTSLRPADYEKGERVLVDIKASVSNELSNQIAQLGGQAINGWQTATSLRAWVPFTQLEAVANLPAIQSMSAARPVTTRRLVH
jgi:hypothetical protein